MDVTRLTVFCGSSPGADPAHMSTAAALGRGLAGRGMVLAGSKWLDRLDR